jgi:hypothetical protein
MTLPFTVDAFLDAFARHNQAIWPAQIAAYALGAATLALALRGGARAGRGVGLLLAGAWAFVGVAYHLVQFSRVTGAAWIYGAAFVLQGVLFAIAALKGRLAFAFAPDARRLLGLLFVAYAAAVYPLLGAALGHGWPRAPVFGVAPCPTTIFTFGVLLLADARVPRWLLPIPFLWSIVGVSAALNLGIREDLGLAVAGLVGTAVLLAQRAAEPARAHGPSRA